jgi:ArsR family transcriptional regulator, arsenate/arsenite/antimonite-responsive transcriptional repressor
MQNDKAPYAHSLRRKSVSAENIYLFKTEVLRALSDETRQGIIVLLGKHGSMCVTDLAAYFNVGRPTVSHHLQVLKEAKVVLSEKLGKEMHYSLNLRNIRRSIKSLDKVLDTIVEVNLRSNG